MAQMEFCSPMGTQIGGRPPSLRMLVEQAFALTGEAPPAGPEVERVPAMAEPSRGAPPADEGTPKTWAYPEEEFQPGSIRNAAEFWRDYLLKDPSISKEDAANMLG